jgi:hypothetical protein
MKNILLIGWWLFAAQQISAQTLSADEADVKKVVMAESDARVECPFFTSTGYQSRVLLSHTKHS